VVCIGEILTHERLVDGKYNFLLHGHTRARVIRELKGKSYRVAKVEPLKEEGALEIDLEMERKHLLHVFGVKLAGLPTAEQFSQVLNSSTVSTADVADMVAFNFLEDVQLKQSLLADADVRRRVKTIVAAMDRLCI